MLQEPRKTEQTTEPRKETPKNGRRFRIVKLEERIAPRAGKGGGGGGNGKTGAGTGCHGHP
jgi:hypothetical protein